MMAKTQTILMGAALVLGSAPAFAAHEGQSHHIAIMGGTGWQSGGNATFAGIDYTYHFDNGNFVGLFSEGARGDFDIEAIGVLFGRKWGDGWKASIGPAIERKLDKNKDLLLVRGQLVYEWHSGSWSWGPQASFDLIENLSDAFYIGFTVGYGF